MNQGGQKEREIPGKSTVLSLLTSLIKANTIAQDTREGRAKEKEAL